MKTYLVQANPKGGTCRQIISAESQQGAVDQARKNPNGWVAATPRDQESWNYFAREVNNDHHRRRARR
jgi:hypothetical protein